ncbi:aminoacyl-tRNA deacylase [Yinghuangia soli]|uniref:YbaK/EbsC family protein n=1 Tax=Yinghuangia soli TaxID=2908204 RepID=A0AA41U900_9ACTN|nr:YbaK/EbsC family protein [Yinghuangia soli]MCF2533399.1 YbaK/EbsC family protein [Yinghuangia soli]
MNAPAPASPSELLTALGTAHRLHEHPGVTTPVEVCAVLGVPLSETVKTLAFVLPDDRLLLAAMPGHARVRYGPLARAAGVRRPDLTPADAARLARAGLQPGGVSPVVDEPDAVVVFDESVLGMGRIHCGGGRADTSIEIRSADLIAAVAKATTAQIAELPDASAD